LLLGVRPEDIELAPGRGLEAVVSAIEYLGADSIVTCAVGGQAVAVRRRGASSFRGARVHLAWAKDAAHVFDAATGRRRDDIPVTADRPMTASISRRRGGA
jgi:sn-glycerol 3-phosphate transport system ATP-binding protein